MSTSSRELSAIPFLGSGLGFRREIKEELFKANDRIDFVEVITEQYMEDDRLLADLSEVCDSFQVIPHGISLSIGSVVPVDMKYLEGVRRICQITKTPYYSEHLCMTQAPGIDIGHLSPLWFNREALQVVIDKTNLVQDFLGMPLILENVTYLFDVPESRMSQAEFFNRLVEATGCGVLLDVTNVFINSVNHEMDADEFLRDMPLENVVQLHLAGGYWSDDIMIDGHSEPVQDGTWKLMEKLVELKSIKGAILEHDANFPEDASDLLKTVEQIRKVMGW